MLRFKKKVEQKKDWSNQNGGKKKINLRLGMLLK